MSATLAPALRTAASVSMSGLRRTDLVVAEGTTQDVPHIRIGDQVRPAIPGGAGPDDRGLPRTTRSAVQPAHADRAAAGFARLGNGGRTSACAPSGLERHWPTRIAIRCHSGRIASSSNAVVHEKTGGTHSRDSSPHGDGRKGCGEFEGGRGKHGAAWRGLGRASDAKGYTDNVVDLMVGKLKRLPDRTQEALKSTRLSRNRSRVRPTPDLGSGGEEKEEGGQAGHSGKSRQQGCSSAWRAPTRSSTTAFRRRVGAHPGTRGARRHPLYLAERWHRGRRPVSSKSISSKLIFGCLNQLDRGGGLSPSGKNASGSPTEPHRRKAAKTSTGLCLRRIICRRHRALLAGRDRWERRYELTFSLETTGPRASC